MKRAVIIEDEILTQQLIQRLVAKIDPDIEILDCLPSVKSAVNWFKKNESPELVFMDVELKDGLSFEIFDKIELNSMIIFITASDQYALKALKANSIDYILKPLKRKELEQAINRYEEYSKEFISKRNKEANYTEIIEAIKNSEITYRKRFLINKSDGIVAILTKDIAYFCITDKVVFAHTFNGNEYIMNQSLDSIMPELDHSEFFKINRQNIVNINSINKLIISGEGKYIVETTPDSTERILLGKDKAAEFKKWFNR